MTEDIKKLFLERKKLREQKKYEKADKLREKIEQAGYEVNDTVEGEQEVSLQEELAPPASSSLVLFGSGEVAPSAVQAHSMALEGVGKDKVSITILSTPAGFQPNVQHVYEEVAEFFTKHLANFHPKIDIIYANTKEEANNKELLTPLEKADYIFTGPGSPTYAVHHLKDTLLLKKIVERVQAGASLSLASAATIAFSRHALPVYEIFKVGSPLYWEEGLNVYAQIFEEMSVIPHYNNTAGGEKLDTSHCFIGKERFSELRKKLPKNEHFLGIDEHTAMIIDLQKGSTQSIGKGKIYRV